MYLNFVFYASMDSSMYYIGTSGYNYVEWLDRFYPAKLKRTHMLNFYAQQFNSVEINYTFYRMPLVTSLTKWAADTPPDFKFSFKAPKQITHSAKLKDSLTSCSHFFGLLETITEKLGVVLFQLPPSFKSDLEVLAAFLQVLPQHARVAFEFRHLSWFNDKTFELLRSHNAALCIADSEILTTPLVRTADFLYMRLRHEGYLSADILKWATETQTLKDNAGDAYVYFKHEDTASGPRFASQFKNALGPASAHDKSSR